MVSFLADFLIYTIKLCIFQDGLVVAGLVAEQENFLNANNASY